MSTDRLNAAIKRLLDIDPWDCTPDEINEAQEFMRIHVAPQPPAALDQSPDAESLSPREVEAQEAFTEMRDEILNLSDGLEVNEVLRIIDNHTPEWV
jgi:hypothetical protein